MAIQLDGTVFSYNGTFALRHGASRSRCVVLVGGLGDGLLSLGYTSALARFCADNDMSLVIPQLRSHPAYEKVAIDSDVDDIESVVGGCEGDVVLIGHSTGCQDILLFLDRHPARVRGAILQGPVSDVEACASFRNSPAEHQKIMDRARDAGRLFLHGGKLWLAERFLSLFEQHGREDLFSSYLGDEAFARWKRPVPILSILSEHDESYPPSADGECHAERMARKFSLMGSTAVIRGASHGLCGFEDAFVDEVARFLREIEFIK